MLRIRQEMLPFVLILTLTVCTATAVGPVMSQQPPTVYDLIQTEPDLSEVKIS